MVERQCPYSGFSTSGVCSGAFSFVGFNALLLFLKCSKSLSAVAQKLIGSYDALPALETGNAMLMDATGKRCAYACERRRH